MQNDSPLFELYLLEENSECQEILRILAEQKIKFTRKDISNMIHLQKLLLITGTKMVPCLFVDGEHFQGYQQILKRLGKI